MKKLIALAAMFIGFAGSASATIVNISATANGENTGGADCSVACVGSLIAPVQVTLQAGTYLITDASAAGGQYDAWNFEAGNGQAWVWHWKALTDDGQDGATINSGNYASHVLFDVDASTNDEFTTEKAAAAFGLATLSNTFTLNSTTTIDFVVNDYDLSDNAGGVSLNITGGPSAVSAAPESGTWLLIFSGLALVGTALRHARARQLHQA